MKDNAVNASNLTGDIIQLHYIPLPIAFSKRIEDNPKKKDIGMISQSIAENGFKDPCAYDVTGDMIVEGNGRLTALIMMKKDNADVPRGIAVDQETGEWLVPVLFGVDAKSKKAALRYSIDHNNITLSGGDFSAFDIQKMWEKDGYKRMLQSLGAEQPISFSLEDLFEAEQTQDNGNSSPNHDKSKSGKDKKEKDEESTSLTISFNEGFADEILGSLEMLADSYPYWKLRVVKEKKQDEY